MFVLFIRREECANRPRPDFVPKTLADLNIEGLGSTDGGMNGGRFIQPNNHLSRNKTNNSHQNVYSSQQNLSKINSNNNNSSFQRSRIYGSQQSLSTVSNRSSTYSIQSNSKSTTQNSFTNVNYNNYSNNNPSSPDWLNAWNSPPSAATTTTVHHTHSSTHSNNYNNRNAHFNDPWTGDFYFSFIFFLFSFYIFNFITWKEREKIFNFSDWQLINLSFSFDAFLVSLFFPKKKLFLHFYLV